MNTDNQGIYDARQLGKPKFAILGLQHLFAMFGATILVPLITGLDVSATLLFAGIGTLIFHIVSKLQVPAFLGSSFAFLGGYASVKQLCVAQGLTDEVALNYACIGVAAASLLYFVMAFLLKMFGTEKVMRFFPPVVTGPMVIAIGLTLSGSAISNCQQNWLLAVTAIAIVIGTSIWGKGIIKIVPILLGVVGSYILAAAMGEVDFSKLNEVAWIGLPIDMDRTAISVMKDPNFDLIVTSIVAICPIAYATSATCVLSRALWARTSSRNPACTARSAAMVLLRSSPLCSALLPTPHTARTPVCSTLPRCSTRLSSALQPASPSCSASALSSPASSV